MSDVKIVKGEFSVALDPQTDESFPVGRMTLDKMFSGALSGPSKGQMLSHRTATEGSAGYVALEVFEGELEGKSGGFVLIHKGTMNKGAQSLVIDIVPDSGTKALSGIAGKMTIEIKDGQHYYELHYTL